MHRSLPPVVINTSLKGVSQPSTPSTRIPPHKEPLVLTERFILFLCKHVVWNIGLKCVDHYTVFRNSKQVPSSSRDICSTLKYGHYTPYVHTRHIPIIIIIIINMINYKFIINITSFNVIIHIVSQHNNSSTSHNIINVISLVSPHYKWSHSTNNIVSGIHTPQVFL